MTLPPFQSRTRAMEAITGLLRGMHQAESGEPERGSKSERESRGRVRVREEGRKRAGDGKGKQEPRIQKTC